MTSSFDAPNLIAPVPAPGSMTNASAVVMMDSSFLDAGETCSFAPGDGVCFLHPAGINVRVATSENQKRFYLVRVVGHNKLQKIVVFREFIISRS
jgi:hypothetical protein